MKNLLLILFVAAAAIGCGNLSNGDVDNADVTIVDSLVVTHIENGDTIAFNESTIRKFKGYFQFDEEVIPPPEDLIKMADDNDEMELVYSSEAGVDNFYRLYSYSLHTEKNLENYILLRNDLVDLYRCLNEIHGTLDYGGTYYGHQYARAIGIAEYWMYQKSIGNVKMFDFYLQEHAQPFLDSLQTYGENKIESDQNLHTAELKTKQKLELAKDIKRLNSLIKNYFHLERIRAYQNKYYLFKK